MTKSETLTSGGTNQSPDACGAVDAMDGRPDGDTLASALRGAGCFSVWLDFELVLELLREEVQRWWGSFVPGVAGVAPRRASARPSSQTAPTVVLRRRCGPGRGRGSGDGERSSAEQLVRLPQKRLGGKEKPEVALY